MKVTGNTLLKIGSSIHFVAVQLLSCVQPFAIPWTAAFLHCSWGFPGENIGMGCHFLLQWTTFCQNSSLWPVCLGWPCTAWLIASLSYASPFSMTRLSFTTGDLYVLQLLCLAYVSGLSFVFFFFLGHIKFNILRFLNLDPLLGII